MAFVTWRSKRIFSEHGVIDGYITIADGKIQSISQNHEGEYRDAGELSIYPGIIDTHNHGFGGWSMTDPCTSEDVQGYVKALASVGVTGILPTAKETAFAAIAEVMESQYTGAKIHGIYSEGPFWARGGENTVGETWPAPDVEETKRLIELAGGKLETMAIAPELPGAYEVIRYLHAHNIKVACCHTAAHAEEIFDAFQKVGFEIATHLGNGMRGIHHRDVGALGALLLLDNVWYEIITDLNHLSADMLRLLFRIQPYERFCLISDSNFIAGLPVGTYIRYGREMYADANGLILNSDRRICGSGSWVLRNMGKLVKEVGVPEETAVRMASLNPAIRLGLQESIGSLREGKAADMIFVDREFNCWRTYVDGIEVYDRVVDTPDKIFNSNAMRLKVE